MYRRNDDQELGPLPEGTPGLLPTLTLTYQQAAAHLHVSKRQIEIMVQNDELPHVRVGRLRRIAYDDLRAWVKRQRKFHSYYLTPETLRLVKRKQDDRRLDEQFGWD